MPFRDIIGHERPIALIQAILRNERLAHAYLFHGEAAIGKRLTALRLTQALNCDRPPSPETLDSCGICRSCLHVEAHTHPDFIVVEPDRDLAAPQIKIEQVRGIEHHFVYRPLMAERKICLIDDADCLTVGAANALLKTLEEPPGHALFILISSRPHALPATIRSRCHSLRFTTPSRTQVEAALILKQAIPPDDARFLALVTEGRIGEALTMDLADQRERQKTCLELVSPMTLRSAGAILSIAETLAKAEQAADVFTWLTRWIRDLVLILVGGDREEILYIDGLDQLKTYARQADLGMLLDVLIEIQRIEQGATRHLNLHMALETLLFRLREALSPDAIPA